MIHWMRTPAARQPRAPQCHVSPQPAAAARAAPAAQHPSRPHSAAPPRAVRGTDTCRLPLRSLQENQLDDPFYEPACSGMFGGNCGKVFKSEYAHILSHWGVVPKGHPADLSLAYALLPLSPASRPL